METGQQLDSILSARFATSEANQEISLYTGRVVIHTENKSLAHEGQITLRWLPRPTLLMEFVLTKLSDEQGINLVALLEAVHLAFEFELEGLFRRGMATVRSLAGGKDGFRFTLEIEQLGVDTNEEVQELTFHLVNFPRFIEDCQKGGSGYTSRQRVVRLMTTDWVIELDRAASIPHISSSPPEPSGGLAATLRRPLLQESLEATAGYGITQVGRLTRVDGSCFTPRSAVRLLVGLRLLLSFSRRHWTCFVLLSGRKLNKITWESWNKPLEVDPWSWDDGRAHSWGVTEAGLNLALLGFLKRWNSKEWRHPVETAARWFIEASTHRSLESALLGAQSALELLAWTHLVEERGILSKQGFDDLTAHDKFKLLLSLGDVPRSLPERLKELKAFASDQNRKWEDGPRAITELRNSVTHPRIRRDVWRRASTGVRREAVQLSLWYLEMVLLWTIGYDGLYLSAWSFEQELVPWRRHEE